MTVKAVSQLSKDMIVMYYKNKSLNQKCLALAFDTSERTINRVLIEAGLLTPVAQLKADAYNVMQVLKKHGIDPSKFEQTLATGYKMPIAHEDVVNYLYDAKREEITELFYSAMMNKALDSQMASSFPELGQPVYAAEGFDDLPF